MFLALLFIASSLFLGWAISKHFPFLDTMLKQSAFSVFAGLFFSTWIALLVSWFVFGNLTAISIYVSITISLIASLILLRTSSRRAESSDDSTTAIVAIAIVLFIFAGLNRFSLFYSSDGSLVTNGMLDGYGALHFSIINSFAYGENFPPLHPFFSGSPLTYPFLVDFTSAVLVVGGLDLTASIILLNILLSVPLVAFVFFLAKEFSKKQFVAVLLLILFFINGNFGVLGAANDLSKGQMNLMAKDYSCDHLHSLRFCNITEYLFTIQRSLLFGFAASLLVLWLLYRFLSNESNDRELTFAGIISGLMPLVYTHSFLAIALLSAYWALRSPNKKWLLFFIPMVLLALPQMIFLSQGVKENFFGVQIGWVAENSGRTLLEIAGFYVKNLPLVVLLAIPAYFFLNAKQKRFVVPFVLLFLLANVVRFQPLDWDNIKFLLFPVMIFLLVAAIALGKAWTTKLRARSYPQLLRLCLLVLIFFSIASGFMAMIWTSFGNGSHGVQFTKQDFQVASWIKQNTPPKSVFVSSYSRNPLVPALSGRQIVLGDEVILWSQGFNYSEREAAVGRMYVSPSCQDFSAYVVDYVLIGPKEYGLHPDFDFFNRNFEKVYEKTFSEGGIYIIYRVRC